MNGVLHWGMILLITLPLQTARLDQTSKAGPERGAALEKLTYEAIPDSGGKDAKEIITTRHDGGGGYLSRIDSPRDVEEFKLEMAPRGEFVSALMTIYSLQGHVQRRQEIRKEAHELVLLEGDKRTSRHKIPPGAMPVVNGSILIQLRFFPFDGGQEWKIFLMDFAGRTCQGRVRQTGRESIEVPAGVFDCYRLEVIVDLYVVHPKNTFWVAASAPHILVKYDGRRGLFSPTYETNLVSREIQAGG